MDELKIAAMVSANVVKFDLTATGAFEGYASVFGNVDSQGDIVAHGAYAEALAKRDAVPMLFNHVADNLIGKAVDLREDAHGLKFNGRLTKGVQMADDAYAHMKAGNLDGVSIGMRIHQSKRADGARVITRATPLEISIVIAPANDMARIDPSTLKGLMLMDRSGRHDHDEDVTVFLSAIKAASFGLSSRYTDPQTVELLSLLKAPAAVRSRI